MTHPKIESLQTSMVRRWVKKEISLLIITNSLILTFLKIYWVWQNMSALQTLSSQGVPVLRADLWVVSKYYPRLITKSPSLPKLTPLSSAIMSTMRHPCISTPRIRTIEAPTCSHPSWKSINSAPRSQPPWTALEDPRPTQYSTLTIISHHMRCFPSQ